MVHISMYLIILLYRGRFGTKVVAFLEFVIIIWGVWNRFLIGITPSFLNYPVSPTHYWPSDPPVQFYCSYYNACACFRPAKVIFSAYDHSIECIYSVNTTYINIFLIPCKIYATLYWQKTYTYSFCESVSLFKSLPFQYLCLTDSN